MYLDWTSNRTSLDLMYSDFILHLYPYGNGVLRALFVPKGGNAEDVSRMNLVKASAEGTIHVDETDSTVCLIYGQLRVEIKKEGFHLRFWRGSTWLYDWDHALFTPKEEQCYSWSGGKPEYTTTNGGVWGGFPQLHVQNWQAAACGTTNEVSLRFVTEKNEAVYGLGQHEKGIYNYRGTTQYLYHTLLKTPMPFFATPKACGLLFDCGCLMKFESGEEDITVTLDSAAQLDVYMLNGENYDEMESMLACLTGHPTMLPLWTFGYVFSKERFHTQEELVETGRQFRHRSIPCDALVQDWKTWVDPYWGSKELDKTRWPDLSKAVQALHNMDLNFMMAVWPGCFPGSRDHTEMAEAGYLLGDYLTYDAFNEDARTLFFEQCRRELLSAGIDAWWADASEPFQGFEPSRQTLLDDVTRSEAIGGAHKRFLGSQKANLYSLAHCGGLYDNTRKVLPEKRVPILTRSVYPGEQRYGVIHWSGDISATWENYRTQLAELLNMSLCGIPYICEDIGGFAVNRKEPPVWSWAGDFEKGVEDPGYRELYVRWMQNGAFLPIFRSHGTDTPREPWFFENTPEVPFYDALVSAIRLRYKFLPYTYSLAGAACLRGQSIMRSLQYDYPQDERAHDMTDEYMFGPQLLVCPVLSPMYYAPGGKKLNASLQWPCWLPKGAGFYLIDTNRYYEGNQTVTVEADISTLPLFAAAGAIIPSAPDELQSTAEYTPEKLNIDVYAGANGKFSLYMDAGDGYAYEKGGYALLPFEWEDATNTLRLGVRQGNYSGMPETQQMHITLHSPQDTYVRMVTYTGEPTDIIF